MINHSERYYYSCCSRTKTMYFKPVVLILPPTRTFSPLPMNASFPGRSGPPWTFGQFIMSSIPCAPASLNHLCSQEYAIFLRAYIICHHDSWLSKYSTFSMDEVTTVDGDRYPVCLSEKHYPLSISQALILLNLLFKHIMQIKLPPALWPLVSYHVRSTFGSIPH